MAGVLAIAPPARRQDGNERPLFWQALGVSLALHALLIAGVLLIRLEPAPDVPVVPVTLVLASAPESAPAPESSHPEATGMAPAAVAPPDPTPPAPAPLEISAPDNPPEPSRDLADAKADDRATDIAQTPPSEASPAASGASDPSASQPSIEHAPAPVDEPPPAPVQQQVEAPPPEMAPAQPAASPQVVPLPLPQIKPKPKQRAEAARRATQTTIKDVPTPGAPEPAVEPSTPAPAGPPAAAPVVVAATTAAPPRDAAPHVDRAWLDGVAQWLRAHRTYPPIARKLGQEGTVLIRFAVDRDGLVTDVAVVRSSGSAMLDDAALALLRGARLPPPRDASSTSESVTVPIRYELN